MGSPFITYNAKTITLTDVGYDWTIDPFVRKAINSTIDGVTDTVMEPRVDVRVKVEFRNYTSATLRVQLDNLWQWLQRGNSATLGFDSAKVVSTTLSANEAAGQTVISLTSVSGIVAGQNYVMISGPYYQLVTVDSVGASTVTLSTSIDDAHASGSIFRDQYLWTFTLTDAAAKCPIKDLINPPNGFDFYLEFIEAPL